jgi:hypothetical protein
MRKREAVSYCKLEGGHMKSIADNSTGSSAPASLNDAQLHALRQYASKHGRTWKSKLCREWETGATHGELTALIRQVRNSIGPSGLRKVTFQDQ